MMIGVLSDTHDCDEAVIRQIVDDLRNRGVQLLIHCGDIEPQHLSSELFGNLPVVCALTKHQLFDVRYTFPPNGWRLTTPGSVANRILNMGPFKIYVGHERTFDALTDPGKVNNFLQELNQVCDGVKLVFSSHIHFQFLIQRNGILWINPGAVVDNGGNGHAFALVDTDKREAIFSRIPVNPITTTPSTIGVVVDTGNITQRDESFWEKLAMEFSVRDARTIILAGNHWVGDIGRKEFEGFQVYYNLLPDQKVEHVIPENWHLIPRERPLINFCGHRLLVDYSWGIKVSEMSEYEAFTAAKQMMLQYHQIDFAICGLSKGALFEEGEDITIINPGDARNGRNFVVICLPREEITFGRVT